MFAERREEYICHSHVLNFGKSFFADRGGRELQTQHFREFLRDRNFGERTVDAYKGDLNDLCGFLVHRGVQPSGSVADLFYQRDYFEDLRRRDYSYATIKRRIVFMACWADWALGKGYLTDPSLPYAIRSQRPIMGEPLPLPDKQTIDALFQAAKESPRDAGLLRVAYEASLTASQIADLKIEDLKRKDNGFVLNMKDRVVQLSFETSLLIEYYLGIFARESGTLFLSEHNYRGHKPGKKLTRQGVWLIFKKYAIKVGHPELDSMTFRLASLRIPELKASP